MTILSRSRAVRVTALVALALAPSAMASAQSAAPFSIVPAVPSLVTSGQGEAKVTPDRASVMINVLTRASTAAAAGNDNAQRTRAVLAALEKLGLPKDQLNTEGYSVSPEMVYGNGVAPRVTGYTVTNTVRAETKQPAQAGAIIDAALGAGANMINGLSFYASSIETPRRQAIALAVANARADAEAMAIAAGGSLGNLLELSTQGPTVPPRPMFDMAVRKGAMAAETPVNPGQLTVNVYVTARWAFMAGGGR
ncbi:MAG: hypothetical protein JWN79_1696 [Gemmatimonadetes bacterium]|jgi:uncharacterized protein YggE|nr:hypothetical protein [Gemmatimonadota bacterium]